MSITGTNNPFSCDPVVFANANTIISLGTITRTGNVFTFSVGFVWKINGVTYQNNAPVELTIAEATEGFNRIDNALLNNANTIELQQGLESETIALRPVAPDTNIILTSWNISGETIGEAVSPTSDATKEDKVSGVIAFGTDNYTATVPEVTELVAGYKILCLFENPNTGASTLNVNVLGVKEIVKEGDVQLVANDLPGVQWLMYDGEKFQLVGHVPQPSNISGTTNFLTKATSPSTFGNSRVFDNGVHLGIDTITPDKDIDFGNQSNREIGIQNAEQNSEGKDLTIKAGNTNQNIISPNFNIEIESLQRNWGCLYTSPDGIVYAGTNTVILNKNISDDTFTTYASPGIGTINKVAVHPDGSVYVPAFGGGIYKQTNGVGAFVNLGFSGNWFGIAAHQNGDVYATRYGGSIFKQTGGTGDFLTLGEPNRNWAGIRCMDNGDVYAIVQGGDIYKQTNGTGSFNALGQTSRTWSDICSTPTGDVYATVQNGSIYKQTGGIGNFIQVTTGNKLWTSITSDLEGNVYAATAISNDGYLYKLIASAPNLNGGTLKLKSGTGKGTGQSRVEIYTSQKTVSGSDLQEETLRVVVDEEGRITAPTLTKELINSGDNKSFVTKEYVSDYTKKAIASTGSEILFDTDRIYNSIAAPTTGTITNNLTGAQIGFVQKIYYNHSTVNPFPAGWVRLGNRTYTASVLNIIYAEWVGGSRVEYWISQES